MDSKSRSGCMWAKGQSDLVPAGDLCALPLPLSLSLSLSLSSFGQRVQIRGIHLVTSQLGRKAYEAEMGGVSKARAKAKSRLRQVRGQKASHFVLARGLYCSCPVPERLVWKREAGPEAAGRNTTCNRGIAASLRFFIVFLPIDGWNGCKWMQCVHI